jgi:hypothetical protein
MGFPNRIITGQPYLYYWINGAAAKIYQWIFPTNQPIRIPILWRLLSVVISTFTVIYCYKLAKTVTGNPYLGILAAFFLSNTLMFTFVSGGISYDNLMNLAAMASIYHLVKVYHKGDFTRQTALLGIWVVIGSLSKEQYLLLALIVFLAWLFFVITHQKTIKLNFSKRNIVISALFAGFLILFLGLYGLNLLRYSAVTPACYQVKSFEVCSGFSERKEYYVPYDIQTRLFIKDHTINPIEYISQYWLYKMAQSIWGILSHKTFIPRVTVGLHSLLSLWGLFCLIRYWNKDDVFGNLLIFILSTYTSYIFYMNYRNEVTFSFQHYGISGRYLSPILGVLITLMIHYFMKIRSIFLKKFTLALSIMLYFSGGLWMYLSRYSEIFFYWRIFK